MRFRTLGVIAMAVVLSAHVGSPDVFFKGKAGNYDVSVVIQPPEVVPGIARVSVRTQQAASTATLRPTFWRSGSRGSPSGDAMRRSLESRGGFSKVMNPVPKAIFEGQIWLMASGAYTVDIDIDGSLGKGTVRVPVASVATGRLALSRGFGAMLVALGVFLVVGLVNIVRKATGESLMEPGRVIDDHHIRRSRIGGAIAFSVIAVGLFGGSRWWDAVDGDYARSIYKPAPLAMSIKGGVLTVAASDTMRRPRGGLSTYVPDHGKLMHLFLVKADDAAGFAHLHPRPDSAFIPAFTAALPPMPAGSYRAFGDVVDETGLERTLIGSIDLPAPENKATQAKLDPDDGWFTGTASTDTVSRFDDAIFVFKPSPAKPAVGEPVTLHVEMYDKGWNRMLDIQPYLGMPAHAVVARLDGSVYVHLHPMGTSSMAAQDVFAARDRGDTTTTGSVRLVDHSAHAPAAEPPYGDNVVEFPYAFPKSGEYRVFVQVKRNGRVMTGAFAVSIAEPVAQPR